MYMQDLKPYRYDIPNALNRVLAVGWLTSKHAFPKGVVEPLLIDKLARAVVTHRANRMRGFHACDLCLPSRIISVDVDGSKFQLGSAEIWIPASGSTIAFASPDLILHYISAHGYRPPSSFLEALGAMNMHADWNAEFEAERLLMGAYGP